MSDNLVTPSVRVFQEFERLAVDNPTPRFFESVADLSYVHRPADRVAYLGVIRADAYRLPALHPYQCDIYGIKMAEFEHCDGPMPFTHAEVCNITAHLIMHDNMSARMLRMEAALDRVFDHENVHVRLLP